MHCAVPMVPGRVAKTAEHRPGCQHSEHRGWTKSQSRVRIGRKGERQGNGTKDGNRPRAHDRSPVCGRSSYTQRAEVETDPPLRRTIKRQLTYVNLTDASFKRTLVIIAKECCEKGTPSLAGRTPFRNLRKLDWCEGRLLER
jgi:hypothetical protein